MSIKTWMCVVAMMAWAVTSVACAEVTVGEQTTTVAQALSPAGPAQAIQLCGALKADDCPDATYCRQHDGVCGEITIGWCAPVAEMCPLDVDPVCGCDGETYSNECAMMSAGVSLSAMGACEAGCASNADCGSGVCDVVGCGDAAMPGACVKAPKYCNRMWAPVCGCDGETYSNDCRRLKAGVGLDHEGPCAAPCGGFAGLTCDDDEVCYYDEGTCEWADQMGVCEAAPEVCPKHIDPVCGCDGETYRNLCMMKRAEVSLDHEGVCCDPMLCLIGEAIDTDGDGCADLCPPAESCEEPNPAGCKNTGCADGEVCTYGLDCTPSICFCDGETGAWMCTKDCGGGTCVPEEDPVDLCADFDAPNPQACTEGSCPEGSTCDLTTGCQASSCHCVVLDGEPHWNCTKDCVPGVCIPDEPVDLCADFEQPGCVASGCDDGFVCDTTEGCVPSACGCDPETGAVMCTADCGGGTCVPEEEPGDLCDEFHEPNPQACTEGSCPEGSTCDLTTGCQASSCHCVVLDGEPHWNCTKDCVPGICVSDAPSEGCCDVDKDCASGELCVHAGGVLGGVCKPIPPPAFPALSCWSDAGCPGDATCDGGTVCPCGAQCFAPDSSGICSGSSDGPGEPDSPEESE